jgi:hypothetical protein
MEAQELLVVIPLVVSCLLLFCSHHYPPAT